jgi:tetratricopeptide (TPR) repeat protein
MKTTFVPRVAALLAALVGFLPIRADHPLGEKLGTVHFAVSGLPAAQAHVVRGVKLTHHMMYPEADREFAKAIEADPNCVFGHWGRAMTILHPLWPDSPTEDERKQGAEHIRRGLSCSLVTPRERAYLEALDRYFAATAVGDHVARLNVLDTAWAELAARFPEDLDALAFSGLYHLAPARFAPKDKSHRIQLEAARRLEIVASKMPDHPGAQHYKIHAYDFPLLADRALEVCDTYGGIAPDVPHALHMPSHIFTRRGYWDKSIDFNLRSAAAARKLGDAAGALNGHYPHALDYLAYAYLQRGQYREADAIRKLLATLNGPYSAVQPTAMAFAFAAIPARYALERQAWSEAAQLPLHQPAAFPWSAQYLNCDSIVHYARAIGAARSGKIDAARAEILELERVHRELAALKRPGYWVAQAQTQVLAARAWVEFAEKNETEAIALMRRATELEATADKEAVTPGEVLPAGDLLGDMLLLTARPSEALAAFEAVLAASPNRLNTLFGAGLSAERAGNGAKAQQYYEQLVKVGSEGDSGIGRLEHARAYVAKNRVARGE